MTTNLINEIIKDLKNRRDASLTIVWDGGTLHLEDENNNHLEINLELEDKLWPELVEGAYLLRELFFKARTSGL